MVDFRIGQVLFRRIVVQLLHVQVARAILEIRKARTAEWRMILIVGCSSSSVLYDNQHHEEFNDIQLMMRAVNKIMMG